MTTRRDLYQLVKITLCYLEKLRNCYINWILCFSYQHVDCLYTLLKYRFNGKIIVKSGNVLDNVQKAISFNQRKRGVDKMPSIAKRVSCEKSSNSILWVLSKKTNQHRPVVQCLQKELWKTKKTKFELELIKNVDCFLDGHGNYDSILVSFKIKSLQHTIVFVTVSKKWVFQKKTKC